MSESLAAIPGTLKRLFATPLFMVLCLNAATPLWGSDDISNRSNRSQFIQESKTSSFRVTGLTVTGTQRTNLDWLEHYLGYDWPAVLTEDDLDQIEKKLSTTGVFRTVEASLHPTSSDHDYELHLTIEEKWTTIPVIRGVYGGGTPLSVLGIYDIHTFGRYLTLGGEMRKYGNAPPGYILYAKDPRRDRGKFFIAGEFWREFRVRDMYHRTHNPSSEAVGTLVVNRNLARFRFLQPFSAESWADEQPWKVGALVEVSQTQPTSLHANKKHDQDEAFDMTTLQLNLLTHSKETYAILPNLRFDNLIASHLQYDGLAFDLIFGPSYSDETYHHVAELDLYWYLSLSPRTNLAAHWFVGSRSTDRADQLYFLGGFDSIRGVLDGAIYGNHATYANIEVRQVLSYDRFLAIQAVAFADVANAAFSWHDIEKDVRKSAGIGLRIAVPKVYRLMLRADYAWSIGHKHSEGFTVGMNHFFDPHKPL